jgi:hypothetical protein
MNTDLDKPHEPEASLAEHLSHDGGVNFCKAAMARVALSVA